MTTSSNSRVILNVNEWDVSAIKYMKPYVTKSGSKTISIISTQLNRTLYISTPMMMTWGCSDFTDANGDSDGKYNISLNFPNDEYRNEQTDAFLQKMKDFENQILDDAVKMAESWWGEPMSREICKHTFFPILKYPKNKDTHKIDYSKAPSFRAKVPMTDGVWKVEIYNTSGELIYPNDNPEQTPDKLITKLSSVACGIQSSGIWIGGKGWGVTWKLVQCVLKPKEVVNITGRCFINIPQEEWTNTNSTKPPQIVEPVVINKPVPVVPIVVETTPEKKITTTTTTTTQVEDSDDDEPEIKMETDTEVQPDTQPEPELPQPVEEPVPTPAPATVPVKKVIKKTINELLSPTPLPKSTETIASIIDEPPTPPAEPVKKKIVKKKV